MVRTPQSKIVAFKDLRLLAEKLHAEKRKIISTNGCFDLLHWGHLSYLAEARALGDVLVCGLNSDRSVKALKGTDRPLCPEAERSLQMAAVEAVDYVVVFDDDRPDKFLEILKPAIHTKGGDYGGKTLPEAGVVERYGGKIVFLPYLPGYSTTALIGRLLNMESKK
jgi:rfaE bifunctional protein nucleotidyltransferase chain/domain